MKLTNKELIEKATVISLLTRRRTDNGNVLPHVAGNLGHPMLAWRVSQALKKMGPAIEEFEGERKAIFEASKIEVAPSPDEQLVEGAEPQFTIDAPKFNKAFEELNNREIEIPDFKPLVWKTIEQARLGEETAADQSEREAGVQILPFDASVVIALGNFLEGEPSES